MYVYTYIYMFINLNMYTHTCIYTYLHDVYSYMSIPLSLFTAARPRCRFVQSEICVCVSAQYVAVRCSAQQCVAMCCSVFLLTSAVPS